MMVAEAAGLKLLFDLGYEATTLRKLDRWVMGILAVLWLVINVDFMYRQGMYHYTKHRY